MPHSLWKLVSRCWITFFLHLNQELLRFKYEDIFHIEDPTILLFLFVLVYQSQQHIVMQMSKTLPFSTILSCSGFSHQHSVPHLFISWFGSCCTGHFCFWFLDKHTRFIWCRFDANSRALNFFYFCHSLPFSPTLFHLDFSFSPSFHLIGHTRNGSDSFLRKLHPLPVCVPPHLPPSPSSSTPLLRRLREEQWCC